MGHTYSSTFKFMALGLIAAILAVLPFYGWIHGKEWPAIMGFPLGWLSAGMVYMATFFHELGHTLFLWLFGYFTLPSFDFVHGGGMAWYFGGQNIVILITVWAALAYGIWHFQFNRLVQAGLGLLLAISLCFSFTDQYMSVADFMGPAAEPLIAAFFLFRALFDVAPRGNLERFLNAYFGWGLILQVFINAQGLLNSVAYRLVYYEQKGSHGFGDFDKIAERVSFLSFENIVWIWGIMALACLIVPFVLRAFWDKYEEVEIPQKGEEKSLT
ncbi:MAG: hypothetical protein AB7E85_01465 [Pseudobdellovibrionaceae bacterium]